MEISQLSFVLLAIYSLCFGVILGMVYDVIRVVRVLLGSERAENKKILKKNLREIYLPIIKRKAYPQKNRIVRKKALFVFVALGDVLFAVFCGAVVVLIAYAYNDGRVRSVMLIGLLIGFLIYYFSVGRLVMMISELVTFVIRAVLVYLLEMIRCATVKLRKVIKNIKIRIKKDKKKGAKNDVQHRKRKIKAVAE